MGADASVPEAEVWPPDWNELQPAKRRLARKHILALSAYTPAEFCAIASTSHVIPADGWRFDDYHAAAAAAVQEDIKLNAIVYKLVPRRISESEFWRLYFSQVLHVLQCVKVFGAYPPPPPPKPTREPGRAVGGREGSQRAQALIDAQAGESSCALM